MSLILYPMRAKARRMLSLVLLTAGSLTAYPQINFPENLHYSVDYWMEMMSLSDVSKPNDLTINWTNHSNHVLSKADIMSLEKVLGITKHHISALSKEEKQFLFKYQHLAIYLSGMNPLNTGEFDRAGFWMLTFPDATRYGLVVNDLVDERRDLVKSTRAAKALFKDLKKRHGANTEAMFVLGAAGWKRSDQESINSVEEDLTALRLISKSFQSDMSMQVSANWVAQVFEGKVSMEALSMELELDDVYFHHKNPTLVGRWIPVGTKVLLPAPVDGHSLITASALLEVANKKHQDSIVNRIKRNIPSPETHKVITHRVKSGEVLGRIAEHYGVRVSKIKKWNNLRSDRIDINQKLTIYYLKGRSTPTKTIAKKTPKPEVKLLAKEIGKFTIYEVQSGDTLWAISKKFADVKPEDIMSWNSIGEKLSIGQKLKIKTLN